MPHGRSIRLTDLSFAGQLVVWALRRYADARDSWDTVEREFRAPLGPGAGARLADNLFGACRLIACAASRRVMLGPMTCGHVWPDEQRLVRAIAAAQRAEPAATLAEVAGFLPPAAARMVAEHLHEVGATLKRAGYDIDAPGPAQPTPGAATPGLSVPAGAVVHPGSRAIH